MMDRPRPPRQGGSSDDDDQSDRNLDASRGKQDMALPDVPPTVDEIWEEADREQSRVDQRFSLRELFLVTTVVAGALAVRRLLRPDWAAALIGICVMLSMLYLAIEPNPARSARITWFTLLALYILFSALAAFT